MHFRAQKKTQGEVSLSDAIESGDDGSLSFLDVIASSEDMLENISNDENYMHLRKLVSLVLTKREGEIIQMRYGLNNQLPKTQREVAEICKISRSYVSRIEKKALGKLGEAWKKLDK